MLNSLVSGVPPAVLQINDSNISRSLVDRRLMNILPFAGGSLVIYIGIVSSQCSLYGVEYVSNENNVLLDKCDTTHCYDFV